MRRPVRVLHASRSVRGARPRFLSFCWRAVFLHRLLLALFILFYGAPWIRIQAPFTPTTWLVGYDLQIRSSCVTFSLSLIHAFVFHETRDIPSSLCSSWNHFSVIRSNIRLSPTSVKISFDFFLLFVPSRPPFSRRVCSFCISYSPVFFVSFEASSER